MKRLLYIVTVLLFASQYSSLNAQTDNTDVRVSVCVGEERLENLLTDEQKDNVTHLTITGTMAEEDYAFIRSNRLKRIVELNFRDADIDTIPPHALDFKLVSKCIESDRVVILPLSLKHIDDYGLCIKQARCKIVLTGMFPTLGENSYRSGVHNEWTYFMPSSDNEFLKSFYDAITSKNDSILYYCYYADIPDSVHVIYSNAFEYLTISDITLPETVDSIGNRAFANIEWHVATGYGTTYNYICFKSLIPPRLGTDVFLNLYPYIDICVPEESFELYKNTEIWKDLNLVPYKGKVDGIGQIQTNNGSLSLTKDGGRYFIKSSKKIYSVKCFNMAGQLMNDMSVSDFEVHLNKNIINSVSLVKVCYEDGTNETLKLKP